MMDSGSRDRRSNWNVYFWTQGWYNLGRNENLMENFILLCAQFVPKGIPKYAEKAQTILK